MPSTEEDHAGGYRAADLRRREENPERRGRSPLNRTARTAPCLQSSVFNLFCGSSGPRGFGSGKAIALGSLPRCPMPVCTKVFQPYTFGCNLIIVLRGLLPVPHFRAQNFGILGTQIRNIKSCLQLPGFFPHFLLPVSIFWLLLILFLDWGSPGPRGLRVLL